MYVLYTFFFILFFILLNIVFWAVQSDLLFTHSICTSLSLLIRNSRFTPSALFPVPAPLPSSPLQSILYVCDSVFIDRFVCVIFYVPYINDIIKIS